MKKNRLEDYFDKGYHIHPIANLGDVARAQLEINRRHWMKKEAYQDFMMSSSYRRKDFDSEAAITDLSNPQGRQLILGCIRSHQEGLEWQKEAPIFEGKFIRLNISDIYQAAIEDHRDLSQINLQFQMPHRPDALSKKDLGAEGLQELQRDIFELRPKSDAQRMYQRLDGLLTVKECEEFWNKIQQASQLDHPEAKKDIFLGLMQNLEKVKYDSASSLLEIQSLARFLDHSMQEVDIQTQEFSIPVLLQAIHGFRHEMCSSPRVSRYLKMRILQKAKKIDEDVKAGDGFEYGFHYLPYKETRNLTLQEMSSAYEALARRSIAEGQRLDGQPIYHWCVPFGMQEFTRFNNDIIYGTAKEGKFSDEVLVQAWKNLNLSEEHMKLLEKGIEHPLDECFFELYQRIQKDRQSQETFPAMSQTPSSPTGKEAAKVEK